MNIEGKKILVVGLGKTGEALCQFLLSKKRIQKKLKKTQLILLDKKLILLRVLFQEQKRFAIRMMLH